MRRASGHLVWWLWGESLPRCGAPSTGWRAWSIAGASVSLKRERELGAQKLATRPSSLGRCCPWRTLAGSSLDKAHSSDTPGSGSLGGWGLAGAAGLLGCGAVGCPHCRGGEVKRAAVPRAQGKAGLAGPAHPGYHSGTVLRSFNACPVDTISQVLICSAHSAGDSLTAYTVPGTGWALEPWEADRCSTPKPSVTPVICVCPTR